MTHDKVFRRLCRSNKSAAFARTTERGTRRIFMHHPLYRLWQDWLLYKCNPLDRCLWAMLVYRLGQWAGESRVAPFRWVGGKTYGLFSRIAPIFTGVYLDRVTRVGKRFHIVHPGMVLIHPRAVFGDNCGVMHGVTVGENMDAGGVPRFGNDCFVGAHATVLGDITIGDGARIAANSLVCCDVPPGALAMGVPARIYPGMANLKTPAAANATEVPPTAPKPGFRTQAAAGQFRGATSGVAAPSTANEPA
jgi:serine O-acetyltransferase